MTTFQVSRILAKPRVIIVAHNWQEGGHMITAQASRKVAHTRAGQVVAHTLVHVRHGSTSADESIVAHHRIGQAVAHIHKHGHRSVHVVVDLTRWVHASRRYAHSGEIIVAHHRDGQRVAHIHKQRVVHAVVHNWQGGGVMITAHVVQDVAHARAVAHHRIGQAVAHIHQKISIHVVVHLTRRAKGWDWGGGPGTQWVRDLLPSSTIDLSPGRSAGIASTIMLDVPMFNKSGVKTAPL
eukprot:6492497-Amphidinium_carterae.4